MGWAFWRKKDKPAPEPEGERATSKRVVPLDRSEEIRRAAKLREYIVGRMNGPASMLIYPLAELRAEVEKHRGQHWYVSAVGKLTELEVLES